MPKASKQGLRKKIYIATTKCIIFNKQLLALMQIEDARNYYAKIKTELLATDGNINKFYEYFETV